MLSVLFCISYKKAHSNPYTILQISVFDPLQLFNSDHDVFGLRLNGLYGESRTVFGLDLGYLNKSENNYGLQFGFGNIIAKNFVGFQFGYILNSTNTFSGFQMGAFNQVKEVGEGIQIGLFNWDEPDFPLDVYYSEKFFVKEHFNKKSGKNHQKIGSFFGLQIALININGNEAHGIQIALANITKGGTSDILQLGLVANRAFSFTGFQIGSYINIIEKDLLGFQLAGLANTAGSGIGLQLSLYANIINNDFQGLQIALGNHIGSNIKGIQLGLVNQAGKKMIGSQIGFLNIANAVKGVQIGIINLARTMSGVQIGLINIILKGEVPFFPIINVSFTFE